MKAIRKTLIHTNELQTALLCPRKALLQRSIEHTFGQSPDNTGYRKALEHILEPFDLHTTQTGHSSEVSLALLEQYKKGRNLRFQANGVHATIPALFQRSDGTWLALYPFASNFVKEYLAPSIWMNREIARRNGIDISAHLFMHLNKSTIRQEGLSDLDYFDFSTHFFKPRGGKRKATIDEQLDELSNSLDFDQLSSQFKEMIDQGDAPVIKCKTCTAPSRCPFYDLCWEDNEKPDDSIAFLSSCSSRNELEEKGITRMKDVPPDQIEGGPLQYAQIRADQNGGEFLDQAALKSWFDQLKAPVSYLDFEWDTYSLPPYEGMKSFDVLCFQYSLHVETENGELVHKNFFAQGDCRRQFIERLIEDMPKEGSIVVFNLEGAERLRLMQLASQFEEYRKPLEAICERMIDLALPFENGSYYHLAQRGRTSLKTLLPLFSMVSYDLLDVHNGMEAVLAYRQAQRAEPEKASQIAREISEYCAMDTYAERELLKGLWKKMYGPEKDSPSSKPAPEPQKE